MDSTIPNPVRYAIVGIGMVLSRLGVIDDVRARRTAELAWPRIVTGLARMSKNAVDVAMVGTAIGGSAIAGVGFALPFWSLGRAIGGGVAGGTIAVVSQRFGADAIGEVADTIRSSVLLSVGLSLPFTLLFASQAEFLVSVLTSDPSTIRLGALYLELVSLGIPFACFNLVGSRLYVGMDDARIPMVIRVIGAAVNLCLNALFLFGFGMGVAGAALGTVIATILVSVLFATLLVVGSLPVVGISPVRIDLHGSYLNPSILFDLVEIGFPVLVKRIFTRLSEFPILAIVGLYGTGVVAAYVIARRIFDLMNTPGWGFSLACSSLVGQELGADDEPSAAAYGRDILVFALVTYGVLAAAVFVLAPSIVDLFSNDPSDVPIPIAVGLVQAACGAVLVKAVARVSNGALNGAGDTRWPFYTRTLGLYGVAIPVAYLGATTPLGLLGLYGLFFAKTGVPAMLNVYRFKSGKWKAVSRRYRSDADTPT